MELENLLVYFLKNTNHSLGRTVLMKYVYLFEYYYTQMFGEQYTNLAFERYKFGPNQSSVVDATYALEAEGIINIHAYENYYGNTSYDHYINDDCENMANYSLDEKEEMVASFIVDLLGKENYRGVLDIAYSTPPMKEIIEEEKLNDCQFHGRVIDMSKSKPIFKASRQSRLEARKRLEAKQGNRGSDQDYYSNILDQYSRFEDTRRRANGAES
ncbi:type II toxin-antitoxin system antitoxin SocA domain-containing protein [Bacillus vallismortis]|uniref:type II toxin-antitoxin system antitoxin SocA domain-containing protein n=1 Tax=Bacillus vallismortis TaxID=72361 RepID=UPI0002888E53|nr:type II toxin-antitoxin system antitoxin SocA domain-containing protein [Bacillus vallismortis]MBG9769419.1 hypothetical protein [Bacillus vallismortis]QAV07494.1 DUF4065 domain-containing protein [Bacillus vallismortis]